MSVCDISLMQYIARQGLVERLELPVPEIEQAHGEIARADFFIIGF